MVITRKVSSSGQKSNKKNQSTKKARLSDTVSGSDDEIQITPVEELVETSAITDSKRLIIEKHLDWTLFGKSVVPLFKAAHLEILITPQKVVYPKLLEEFYSNLKVTDSVFVSSVVKGKPLAFEASFLGYMLGIPFVSDGVCPYTSHKPFNDIPGLPHKTQIQLITGLSSFPDKSMPSPQQLTPLAYVLFRIIHSNICPRSSGKDRVTNQDVILMALLISSTPFSFPKFMIALMHHSSKHKTMCLPYASLLSKVFLFHGLVNTDDVTERVVDVFDDKFLYDARIKVDSDGQLQFIDVKVDDPVVNFVSDVERGSVATDLESIEKKLLSICETQSQFNKVLESLAGGSTSDKGKVNVCESEIDELSGHILRLSEAQKLFGEFVKEKFDEMGAKIHALQGLVFRLDRSVTSDFCAVTTASKLWEVELVKMFKKISSEVAFVAKQSSAIQPLAHDSALTWKKYPDWFFMQPGDKFSGSASSSDGLSKVVVPTSVAGDVPDNIKDYFNSVIQKTVPDADGKDDEVLD